MAVITHPNLRPLKLRSAPFACYQVYLRIATVPHNQLSHSSSCYIIFQKGSSDKNSFSGADQIITVGARSARRQAQCLGKFSSLLCGIDQKKNKIDGTSRSCQGDLARRHIMAVKKRVLFSFVMHLLKYHGRLFASSSSTVRIPCRYFVVSQVPSLVWSPTPLQARAYILGLNHAAMHGGTRRYPTLAYQPTTNRSASCVSCLHIKPALSAHDMTINRTPSVYPDSLANNSYFTSSH